MTTVKMCIFLEVKWIHISKDFDHTNLENHLQDLKWKKYWLIIKEINASL